MSENPFRPICDKAHFPILSACSEQLIVALMGCDELTFIAPEDIAASYSVMRKEGVEWHLYGDTRWPSRSAWVEFPLSGRFSGQCGVLVLNVEIPADAGDVFEWATRNSPLSQVSPEASAEGAIRQRLELLRTQAASDEAVTGPEDSSPRFVQTYCIYRLQNQPEAERVATYTDLLNADGIPIRRYRTATVQSDDIVPCRFALHCLFRLNEARLSEMGFLVVRQLSVFGPVHLSSDQKGPRWAHFHPSRILRTRPRVRSLPLPTQMVSGVISGTDFQNVMQVRRREATAHMLAFDRLARPRETRLALIHSDCDSTIAAFVHRANGGAIYVFPDGLAEEFDKTDCGEVRVVDIKLPFPNVFLKFTPPERIFLADGAPVDGCYVVNQGNEYVFTLTSKMDNVDYERSISIACLDPTFSLHLPANEPEMSVNTAVERGIEKFLALNAPPEENLSTTLERPDGTVAHFVDVRVPSRRRRIEVFRSQESIFRACLNIVINAACFIAFRPDDISEDWEGEPPQELINAANDPRTNRRGRDRKRDALRKLDNGDYTRVRICGRDMFSQKQTEGEKVRGAAPRAHWRRGHWRRQRHGPSLSLVVLRWIRPTLVMGDSGAVVEARIYDVPMDNPGLSKPNGSPP